MRQDSLFGHPPLPTPGTIIPAITLWQPWASLLFTGHKIHETRSWEVPSRLVGRRVAIHAGATLPSERQVPAALRALAEQVFGADWRKTLPAGAVLGTCVLSGSVRTNTLRHSISDDDLICGIWTDGRWAWVLDDVTSLPVPVITPGAQGIWNWKAA